jgi:hypothetical protein
MHFAGSSRAHVFRPLIWITFGFLAAAGSAQTTGAEFLMQLAREAQQAGKPERAREYLDDLIARVPDLADAYYQRAQLRKETGDDAGASADLDQVIALKPNLASAYGLRAKWRSAAGDYAGAIEDSVTAGDGPEKMALNTSRCVATRDSRLDGMPRHSQTSPNSGPRTRRTPACVISRDCVSSGWTKSATLSARSFLIFRIMDRPRRERR